MLVHFPKVTEHLLVVCVCPSCWETGVMGGVWAAEAGICSCWGGQERACAPVRPLLLALSVVQRPGRRPSPGPEPE